MSQTLLRADYAGGSFFFTLNNVKEEDLSIMQEPMNRPSSLLSQSVKEKLTESDLNAMLTKIISHVKDSVAINLTFCPQTIIKYWILFQYVPVIADRVILMQTDQLRSGLKLKGMTQEQIQKAASFCSTANCSLTLNKLAWENMMDVYFSRLPSPLPLIEIKRIRGISGMFFEDIEAAFDMSVHLSSILPNLFSPTTKTTDSIKKIETDASLEWWKKIVFILKLYKNPAGSLDDVSLWGANYGKTFTTSKAKVLEKYPTIPLPLIATVIEYLSR